MNHKTEEYQNISREPNRCWSVEDFHGWNKISVKDRIDSFNQQAFQDDLTSLISDLQKPLALDVSKLQFLSLKAIQFLDGIAKRFIEQGLRVALVAPSEKLKRQIDIYADLERWEVFRSLSDLKANHPDLSDYRNSSDSPYASQ